MRTRVPFVPATAGPVANRRANVKRLCGALLGASVTAAFLAASSGATIQAPAGDTCTASGTGTTYTLSLSLAPNAPIQGGFAVGAPGVTVKSLSVSGTQGEGGTFSISNLPANTTGQLLLSAPTTPGASLIAVVLTSGPVKGPFTVVPASSPAATFFDPFLCAVESTPTPNGRSTSTAMFTTGKQANYNSATGGWQEIVTVPASGTVRSVEELPTTGGVASKPLIDSAGVSTKSAGKVTLMLKPTGDGKETLRAHGSITIKLSITFQPKNGKSTNQIIGLSLKK